MAKIYAAIKRSFKEVFNNDHMEFTILACIFAMGATFLFGYLGKSIVLFLIGCLMVACFVATGLVWIFAAIFGTPGTRVNTQKH